MTFKPSQHLFNAAFRMSENRWNISYIALLLLSQFVDDREFESMVSMWSGLHFLLGFAIAFFFFFCSIHVFVCFSMSLCVSLYLYASLCVSLCLCLSASLPVLCSPFLLTLYIGFRFSSFFFLSLTLNFRRAHDKVRCANYGIIAN